MDLSLGVDNLPGGSVVRLGSARLAVTAIPHPGCPDFAQRFGEEALRWVNALELRPRRLRGVNCRVLEAGEVAVGDAVSVERRGP